MNSHRRSTLIAFLVFMFLVPGFAGAAEQLIGHKTSISKYSGVPATGRLFKLIAKAGSSGNPAAFTLPGNPVGTANSVFVQRDGGAIADSLTAGVWKGLGNPVGSKGWKYKNKDAPTGGAVKVLIVKQRVLKVIAKGVGSMPVPVAPNGDISMVIGVDAERYCTAATAPHLKEVDGKLIKAKNQSAPTSCGTSCVIGTDSDGDRLDDCFETNTGIFVSGVDTGTDPLDADTDDDDIRDGDEVLGTTAGLDLPGLGVNPLRQDILIEYDWFDDSLDCAAHSHQPTTATLNMVTTMFANAPTVNPDGSTGINFIHDVGQGGLLNGGNFIADGDGVLVGGVSNAEFQNYKTANFATNRFGYFHYTILPHRYNTSSSSSGQAEIHGDDMIVSLYCAFSDRNVAHTIAHELGHNLFLFHGGNVLCNYKPNYNSIMNYLYQFPGVDNDCTPPGNLVLDYSIGDRITLDENDLDENDGTCGAPDFWDWNGNSTIESSVVFDVNSADDDQELFCGGTLSSLSDFNDWANIRLTGLPSPGAGAGRSTSLVIDCDNPAPAN